MCGSAVINCVLDDPIEGDVEGRERFWNDLDMNLDSGMGDLNGWVGDRVRVDITGTFEVTGESYNRRRVIDFYAERMLPMSNTYFNL